MSINCQNNSTNKSAFISVKINGVSVTQSSLHFVDWDNPNDQYLYCEQSRVKRGNADGYDCKICNDFFPMAEINMPDKTFQCYCCRNGV